MIMVRRSMTSFIGIVRTEVAVGISSEVSMFLAVRSDAPRSTERCGCSLAGAGRAKLGASAGRYESAGCEASEVGLVGRYEAARAASEVGLVGREADPDGRDVTIGMAGDWAVGFGAVWAGAALTAADVSGVLMACA